MPNALRLLTGAVLAVSFLAFRVSAESDLPVYVDSLENEFHDWNSAPHSLTNTAPVHSAPYSIQVNPTRAWQGISLYHADLDTTPYSTLSFWVNGGTNGGQRLQVQAKVGPGNPEPNVYYRFIAPGGSWRQFVVSLASLGAADKTNLTAIWIQLVSGSDTNSFYIDDVQLNLKPTAIAAAPAPLPVATPSAPVIVQPPSASATSIGWWIVGALVVIIGLLAWLAVMFRKSSSGKTNTLLPAVSQVTVATVVPGAGGLGDSAGTGDWQKRALAAEAVAAKQAEILREKVTPELTEFAKGALVQGLYSQQNALVEIQRRAQEDLAELEERLATLHLPFTDRVQAYESRIVELERQMNARNDEMRELTQVTLQLVRQRLAEEKNRERETRFN